MYTTAPVKDVYELLDQESAFASFHNWEGYAQSIDETRTDLNTFLARHPFHVVVKDWESQNDENEQAYQTDVAAYNWLDEENISYETFEEAPLYDAGITVLGFPSEKAATLFKLHWT